MSEKEEREQKCADNLILSPLIRVRKTNQYIFVCVAYFMEK